MTINQLEVEIKSLLGTKEKKDNLLKEIEVHYPDYKELSKEKQLNHYFNIGNFDKLWETINSLFSEEQKDKFKNITENGVNHSVRTRWIDKNPQTTILVIKAALDNKTGHTGVSRIEFEAVLNMGIENLDKILIDCGFEYLSKWSREREEYEIGNMILCLDKNAGYGYVAEFEMVVNPGEDFNKIESEIRETMRKLGVEELNQGRHDRMFEHYNKNWKDYYGTENVFEIL